MDENYYKAQIPVMVELAEKSASMKWSFLQTVLLSASGGLGILIALHSNVSADLYIRVLFLLVVVLILCGILTTTLALYDLVIGHEHLRQNFSEELQNALNEDREIRMVTVPEKKRTKICVKLTCVFLPLSLLLLTVYSALLSFC